MTVSSESSSSSTGNWLFKNKEHGKASAAASLVLYCLSKFMVLGFKVEVSSRVRVSRV